MCFVYLQCFSHLCEYPGRQQVIHGAPVFEADTPVFEADTRFEARSNVMVLKSQAVQERLYSNRP